MGRLLPSRTTWWTSPSGCCNAGSCHMGFLTESSLPDVCPVHSSEIAACVGSNPGGNFHPSGIGSSQLPAYTCEVTVGHFLQSHPAQSAPWIESSCSVADQPCWQAPEAVGWSGPPIVSGLYRRAPSSRMLNVLISPNLNQRNSAGSFSYFTNNSTCSITAI